MVTWPKWIRDWFDPEDDGAGQPEDSEEPIDAEAFRESGKPVLCIVGERGLVGLDRGAYRIRPIGDDLYVIVGFALEYQTRFADMEALARRGFEGPDVWDIARANTAEITPFIPDARELIEERDFCFESDLLVPSMMAELAVWDRLAAEVGGDLYVAPVSDCFTLVGMAADGEALDEVAAGARSDYASMSARNDPTNRAISPHVYRFRDGGWRRA